MNTENKIISLLKEPIAKHFLDSGGAYGYRFEKNAKRNFRNEKEVTFDIWKGSNELTSKDIEYSVSTFHYLSSVLELDEFSKKISRIVKIINRAIESNEDNDFSYLIHWTNDLADYLKKSEYADLITDITESYNTYNFDCHLDQTLQFFQFKYDGTQYIGLQVHGGCDVRGGYTTVQVFKLIDWVDYFTASPNVYGSVDGVNVDNLYDGYSLTDENGQHVPITEQSIIELEIMPY